MNELYRKALAITEEQDAKHWELRAAASLARLRRDRVVPLKPAISWPVYRCFIEGFATPDLKDSKGAAKRPHCVGDYIFGAHNLAEKVRICSYPALASLMHSDRPGLKAEVPQHPRRLVDPNLAAITF